MDSTSSSGVTEKIGGEVANSLSENPEAQDQSDGPGQMGLLGAFLDLLHDAFGFRSLSWGIRFPWINQCRPYIALDITIWGYQMYNRRERKNWHIGIGYGRQFMPTKSGRWFWGEAPGRWERTHGELA